MQTFLPYENFKSCALVLDRQRLGKQRVEARQILNAIMNGGGWSNHPAVRMWRGYEDALILYGNIVIEEWVMRGYRNNMETMPVQDVVMPGWIGDGDLHASHRSNLLRKDFAYYSRFGWSESCDLQYVWPVQKV
jgi:hypothetical protein